MSNLQEVYQYIDGHKDLMIGDLQELVRQPSVSATNTGIRECAELLVRMMGDVGIDARVMETDGLPVVFGEVMADQPDAPTLLIYNHYDVQPADKDEGWDTPPFEACLIGDRVVGRGATDAKGNLMAHLKAVEALRATIGLPINIKLLFDGEEEIGSQNLPAFVEKNLDLLRADAALSFDGGFGAGDIPIISLGSSGLLFIHLRARGGEKDLHSGRARLVPNPAWKLVWALASMKDQTGKVLVDGFYDDIQPPTELERELLERSGWDDEGQKKDYGVNEFLGGVSGIDAAEKLLFTPTCNISGFESGEAGAHENTLVPSIAQVNMDFRLVMDQDPEDIFNKVQRHLIDHGFDDIELKYGSGVEPSRTSPDSPFAQIVADAAREVYKREPSLKPTGEASGRQAVWLAGKLGVPGAGTGVGPPDWHGHAANEFMTVGHFLDGVKYAATIWTRFGQCTSR